SRTEHGTRNAGGEKNADGTVHYIQVPEAEWVRMNSELSRILAKMEENEKKAEAEKVAEKEKKWRTPQHKLGGRFYFDGAAGSQNDIADEIVGDMKSGAEFRTARFILKGGYYDMIEYELGFDFSGSEIDIKNAYIGFYNLPSGIDFRAGHFKEPWSLENLSSSTTGAMMERSVMNCLKDICGGRNNGLMWHNWHDADRWTWAAGIFTASMPESLEGADYSENIAFTGRLTFLPFYQEYECGRKNLWHIGGSFSTRKFCQESADDNGTQLKVKAGSDIPSSIMSTTPLYGLDSLNGFLVEMTLMNGPLSFDFEQSFLLMEDDYAGDATVSAGYAQFSWILTGESREYQKKCGYFGRLKPNNPFIRTCRDGMSVCSGPGAWQLAYRCGWIDLGELSCAYYDAAGAKVGRTLSHTVGLNWYLNENCRVMFNYIYSETDYVGPWNGKTGKENIFATRIQLTF
ncbi:MAG: porin, partial [Planctomycetia bacterium]|nr:porin [Planctomycetia bacterium]